MVARECAAGSVVQIDFGFDGAPEWKGVVGVAVAGAEVTADSAAGAADGVVDLDGKASKNPGWVSSADATNDLELVAKQNYLVD